jgi:hypothetical protein
MLDDPMRSRAPFQLLVPALLSLPLLAGCAELGIPAPVVPDDPLAGASPEASLGIDALPAFVASSDGYSLTLPPDWAWGSLGPEDTTLALDVLGTADSDMAELARQVLGSAGARISLVAGDPATVVDGQFPVGLAVLVMPAIGIDDEGRKDLVAGIVRSLPTSGEPVRHSVVTVPAGDAHRYDLAVEALDGSAVALRLLQFSVGDDVVILTFGAPAPSMASAQPTFESIVKSLRFGV